LLKTSYFINLTAVPPLEAGLHCSGIFLFAALCKKKETATHSGPAGKRGAEEFVFTQTHAREMSQQDWQPVGWNRPPRAAVKQTQAKEGRPGDKATRRLADATEAQAVPQMPLSVGKTLSQARAARGLTQAKLAQQTCVPAKVIQEYPSIQARVVHGLVRCRPGAGRGQSTAGGIADVPAGLESRHQRCHQHTPSWAPLVASWHAPRVSASIYNNRVSQLGQSAFGTGHQPVN
jgi:hypothetical protein